MKYFPLLNIFVILGLKQSRISTHQCCDVNTPTAKSNNNFGREFDRYRRLFKTHPNCVCWVSTNLIKREITERNWKQNLKPPSCVPVRRNASAWITWIKKNKKIIIVCKKNCVTLTNNSLRRCFCSEAQLLRSALNPNSTRRCLHPKRTKKITENAFIRLFLLKQTIFHNIMRA